METYEPIKEPDTNQELNKKTSHALSMGIISVVLAFQCLGLIITSFVFYLFCESYAEGTLKSADVKPDLSEAEFDSFMHLMQTLSIAFGASVLIISAICIILSLKEKSMAADCPKNDRIKGANIASLIGLIASIVFGVIGLINL